MHKAYTTITIQEDTYNALKAIKEEYEFSSLHDVIVHLIRCHL